MKHRLFVAIASVLLAALILWLLPPAHPGPGPTITTTPTQPTVSTDPTVPPTTEPEPLGVVRLYCCIPTVRDTLSLLASEYSAETGQEVVILSPDEDGCQATLQRLLQSDDPPTVFCVHSRSQLEDLEESLLDLQGSPLMSLLRSQDMALELGSKKLAIPMDLRAYGLLFNAELLAGKALTRSDITDFSSLSTAVQILKDGSVKAFPTPAPSAQDAWYLLAGTDQTHTRDFLDLYLTNYVKSGDALTQFLDGRAAFLPGSSWDYSQLENATGKYFHVRNLDILPTYIGGAMQYFCQWALGFHSGASAPDQAATLAFLTWLTTATDEAAAPIDRLQLLTPFAGGAWYGNQLEKKLLGYMANEPAVPDFDDASADNEVLPMALTAYLQNPTDENWEQLRLCIELLHTPPLTE